MLLLVIGQINALFLGHEDMPDKSTPYYILILRPFTFTFC